MLLTATLGDYVWVDTDGDGQQDSGEPGLNAVLVELRGAGLDGMFFTGDDYFTSQSTANNGTNDGAYKFIGLVPGDYKVTFYPVAGYSRTEPNVAPDGTDSDASVGSGMTQIITLSDFEVNDTVDAGYSLGAAIGDFVWNDLNANGIQDTLEPGIPNATVNLKDAFGDVIDTTTTDADGMYWFTNLAPGAYSVQFELPDGFSFPSPQDNGVNDDRDDSDADQITGMTTAYQLDDGQYNDTIDAGYYNGLPRLGDFVWNDLNCDGQQDANEPGINGVTVILVGAGLDDQFGTSDDTTDVTITANNGTNDGAYLFTDLAPGRYLVAFFDLPVGYVFTTPDVGDDTTDSDADPMTGNTGVYDLTGFANFTVDAGLCLERSLPVDTGDTATIGFWQNQNGQRLIKSLNGSASSTAFASWLATTYPGLYGAGTGNYSMLDTGGIPLTNTAVAAKYISNFFKVKGQKTNAQVFGVALATYATSQVLSGGNYAAPYGFNTSSSGVGSHTISVGSSGAAFGVPNNTVLSLNQLLSYTNSQAVNGILYNGNQTLINAANTVYDRVNNAGDIMLNAEGLGSGDDQAVLVAGLKSLNAGTMAVAVDQLTGPDAAAMTARISDAIKSLNAQLASLSQPFELVLVSDPDLADVQLHLAEKSDIGSVANGMLGCLDGNDITMISDWNWYAGADASGISPGQYDFTTAVTHELAHALGLRHSTDKSSVMYSELATSQVRRSLSSADLKLIDAADDELDPGFLEVGFPSGSQAALGNAFIGLKRLADNNNGITRVPTSLFGIGPAGSRCISGEIDSSRWSSSTQLQTITVSDSASSRKPRSSSGLTIRSSKSALAANSDAPETLGVLAANVWQHSVLEIDAVFADSGILLAK